MLEKKNSNILIFILQKFKKKALIGFGGDGEVVKISKKGEEKNL